jgi:Bifunctional DNA primase/polymerase, N-terminal
MHADRDYTNVPLEENPLFLGALWVTQVLGLRVFPGIGWKKHPHITDMIQRATRKEQTITAWWTTWPNANPAIPTGQPIGGDRLVIADIDTPEAMLYVQEQGWPVGMRTTTRRGEHLWYRRRGSELPVTRQGKGRRIPGIDLKGAETYVLGPTSRVRSDYLRLDAVAVYLGRGVCSLHDLPLVPAEIDAAMAPDPKPPPPAPRPVRVRPEKSGQRADWLAEVREGHRSAAIFSILLQAQGLDRAKEEVFAEIETSPVSARLAEEPDTRKFLERQWDRASRKYEASCVTKERGVTQRQEADLKRVEKRWAKAWKAGKLDDTEYDVLNVHLDTARECGVDYYLAVSTVSDIVSLSGKGVHAIEQRLIRKGWLEDLGSPRQSQAHYWAIMDGGSRLNTGKNPMNRG